MNITAILICTGCQICCGIGNFRQGDYPHDMMWSAYGLANCGLLWYEFTKVTP